MSLTRLRTQMSAAPRRAVSLVAISTAVLAAILAWPAAGQLYAQSPPAADHPNASTSDPCTGPWTLSPASVTLNVSNQWKAQVTVTPPTGCVKQWYAGPAPGATFNLHGGTSTGYYVTGPNTIGIGGDPNPPTSPDTGTMNILTDAGNPVAATVAVTDITAPPLAFTCPASTAQVGVL